jgi:hypothetical protein
MSLPELIDVETLFADPVFSNAAISPDGTRVAYLAPNYGRTNVWVRGIDQEHADAVCVTHDKRRGIKGFGFTDDPRWLIYIQDTDGNEDWHLYRVDLEHPDAPAVDLTPMDPGSRVLGMARLKSKPGTMLISMNKRPLFIDAFRVEVATGKTELHLEAPDQTGGFLFGPDGEPFYNKQAEDGVYEFYAIEASGELRLIRRQGGPEHPVGIHPMHVEPGGTGLLLGSYGDGDDMQLVRIDAATGEETVVAARPGTSLSPMGLESALLTSRQSGKVYAARFVGDRDLEVLDPHFAEVYAELTKLSDGALASVSSDEAERCWIAT